MTIHHETPMAAACTGPSDDSDLFDPAEALDRACDDLELMAELADIFRDNQQHLLASLKKGVDERCAHQVTEAAHSLKGSIGTFSTKRPFRLATELEHCGKQNQFEAAPDLLDALQGSLNELNQAITTFLNTNS